ncbi:MAG: hypothetical protein U5L73_15975 [Rhodoferax sp.]|uniref:hypothetical protein n=1 Tax=Rhodoferax sp. TaxID=50421 RepID=UPI002ACD7245|nr:hypothetical protein [Rhodoferax sp.]MDZ7893237.1 hypothetical protein [Rhodoferax sp.]
MNFLDTAKDSAAETLNTMSATVAREVNTYRTAYTTILLFVVVSLIFGAAGYFLGYAQGGLAR